MESIISDQGNEMGEDNSKKVLESRSGGTLRRQRQANLCEFKTCLVYRVSSRTDRDVTPRNPVSKHQNFTT